MKTAKNRILKLLAATLIICMLIPFLTVAAADPNIALNKDIRCAPWLARFISEAQRAEWESVANPKNAISGTHDDTDSMWATCTTSQVIRFGTEAN